MANNFEIRICENPSCGLRYPLKKGHPFGVRCPVCLGSTKIALTRELPSEPTLLPDQSLLQFEGLLDNIRSAWNVGAIFRTADCLGVNKLYLCGITPTPANQSLVKTALGANETVKWEYSPNALALATRIKNEGARLWALEQDAKALPIYTNFQTDERPIVLIVGNEVSGVDPDLLDICERIIYIPMLGKKRSLNVEVAFGAAVSVLRSTNR